MVAEAKADPFAAPPEAPAIDQGDVAAVKIKDAVAQDDAYQGAPSPAASAADQVDGGDETVEQGLVFPNEPKNSFVFSDRVAAAQENGASVAADGCPRLPEVKF